MPLLPAGDYVVIAARAGFRRTSVEPFHLEAGVTRTLALTLQPGGPHEFVRVTADAVSSRTSAGAVAEVFDGRLLTMTPVASRDVGEYAWQAPGAAPPAPGSRLSGEGGTPANVAGARETSNNFLLDGVDNNDLFLNRVLVTPSLDAVQEFTLLTNTLRRAVRPQRRRAGQRRREVGRASGCPDRSTSYFRDRALEARGAFDLAGEPEPFRRRHQAGGTLGGPLARLKSFYFVSVEGTRDRTADDATRARADRGRARRRFQQRPFADRRPVLGRAVSRQPDSRVANRCDRALASPRSTRCRTGVGEAATSARRRSVRRTVWQVTIEDRPSAAASGRRFSSATASSTTIGTIRSRRPIGERARLRHADARRRAEPRGRADAVVLASRVFNELRVGWNRLRARRRAGQQRHRRLRRARA